MRVLRGYIAYTGCAFLLLGGLLYPYSTLAASKKQKAFTFLFSGQERLVQDAIESTEKGSYAFESGTAMFAGVLPHHAPLTFPLIARFYHDLSLASPTIDTFIILGPDHFNQASSDIVASPLAFQTPYGNLRVDTEILGRLSGKGLLQQDKKPFAKEHAIHSHTVFIKRFFPHARVVAVAFRASAKFDQAKALGKFLRRYPQKQIFIVASVDFSHYLPEKEARTIDVRSAELLSRMTLSDVSLIDVDSPAALTTLLSYLRGIKKGVKVLHQEVYNTADFSSNYTNTTGYITSIIGQTP